jgi:hypothetical protein
MNTPDVTERFLGMGTIVVGRLAATVRKEMETSGKLIRALGIRAD